MDSVQVQFAAWVNDVAKKREDIIIGEMERYLTDKGYAELFEINGANLIAAIEKQIPKKPNYVAIPHCSCGGVIGKTDNYCRICGQRIKRGD